MSDAGKGFDRRPQLVTDDIMSLKWELWQRTTTPERKAEIKKKLKELGAT